MRFFCLFLVVTSRAMASSATWWDPMTLSQRQMWMFTNMMRMFPWRFQQKWDNVEFICNEAQSGSLPLLSWCPPVVEATTFQATTLLDPMCSTRQTRGNTDTCSKFCNSSCTLMDRIHHFCPACGGAQELILQGRKVSPIAALEWWAQDRDSCPVMFNPEPLFLSASHGLSTQGILPDVFVSDFVEACPGGLVNFEPRVVHVVWTPKITCFYTMTFSSLATDNNPSDVATARLHLCSETRDGIPMNLLFEDDSRDEMIWELCFSPYLWTHFCTDNASWETVLLTHNYSSSMV